MTRRGASAHPRQKLEDGRPRLGFVQHGGVAHAGDLGVGEAGRGLLHLIDDGGAEQVRGSAAHQQGRLFARQSPERWPQVGDQGLGPGRLERRCDVGIVVQHRRPFGPLAEDSAREGGPVRIGIIGKGRLIDASGVGCSVVPAVDHHRLAGIGGDAGQALGGDFGADVVQDGGGDGFGLQRRQRHGDQPAHRGAEEDRLLDPRLLHQGDDVLGVDVRRVGHGVGRPVRPAAPTHVDGQDAAPAVRDQPGDDAEIGAVARQAVDGDDRQAGRALGRGVVAGVKAEAVGRSPAALDIAVGQRGAASPPRRRRGSAPAGRAGADSRCRRSARRRDPERHLDVSWVGSCGLRQQGREGGHQMIEARGGDGGVLRPAVGVKGVDPQAGARRRQVGFEQALDQSGRPEVFSARMQDAQKLGLGPQAHAAVADLADPIDLAHGQTIGANPAGQGAGVKRARRCAVIGQAQARRLAQQPDPFHVMARLDALALGPGADAPVAPIELAQHQMLAVEEAAVEQVQHRPRRRLEGGIGRRRLPGQQGLQHMHVRVLAAGQGGGQGLLPAAVLRVGHLGLYGGQGLQRQRPRPLVLQHPMRARKSEQDEGQIIQVRRGVDDRARIVRGAHPQAVVPTVAADQGVQGGAGDGLALAPAQRRRLGEDMDLARLNPCSTRNAGDGTPAEIQLLIEAPVGVDPGSRPQRQSLAEQPVANLFLGGGVEAHDPGLGGAHGFAKPPLRCIAQREVTPE
uniref:PE-PGRS family protein n=1 Tax=Parastrongyloides trichosuri TaxID=131310 RepID=A0A0N4ZIW6_PARTI